MLLEMRLRSLGVIREAVLELGPGLTVVTGETGAGKTMVVTGLGLLMGGRADAGAVRMGEAAAMVEARVLIDPQGPVAELVDQAGALLDDGDVLTLARTVWAEGRSRAHVGGRSAPVGLLTELGERLITVHGQGEAVRLRSAGAQREAVDRYAGDKVSALLAEYGQSWSELNQVTNELDRLTREAVQRSQEAEILRLGLAEAERVAPQPGEDLELKAEASRLSHAEELRRATDSAHAFLAGTDEGLGGDVTTALANARQLIESVAQHDEATLGSLAARLSEVGYLVADIAAECAAYGSGVEVDPARLASIEDRRAALGALTRTHGTDVDGVLAWMQRSSERLAELDGAGESIEGLARQREELRARLGELATQISAARSVAALSLATAVTAELHHLSMPDARLEIAVTQREDENGLPVELPEGPRTVAAGPHGVDEVELLLVPHAGAPARPLAKGASGGELSRVMLGLEVVLGAVDPVDTFVFDEVDAGVGGRAGLGIGKRLARLAQHSQVIVVTHLPQVAAFGDRHLHVRKGGDGQITESGVHLLDRAARVEELARMLGGVDSSDSAQAHAEELLAMAESDRVKGAQEHA